MSVDTKQLELYQDVERVKTRLEHLEVVLRELKTDLKEYKDRQEDRAYGNWKMLLVAAVGLIASIIGGLIQKLLPI